MCSNCFVVFPTKVSRLGIFFTPGKHKGFARLKTVQALSLRFLI